MKKIGKIGVFLFLIFVLTGISLLVQEILGMRITRLTMVGALITCYGSYFFTYSKWANNNIWNKKTSKPVETIKPKPKKTSKADNSNSEYIKIDKKLFNTILIVLGVIVVFYIGYNSAGNSNASEVNYDYSDSYAEEYTHLNESGWSTLSLSAEEYTERGDYIIDILVESPDNTKRAIQEYTKAIKVDPNYMLAYLHRGIIKSEYLEDYKGACEDFKKAVNLGDTTAADWVKEYCN